MTRLTKKDRQFIISLLRRYIRGIEKSERAEQYLCYVVICEKSWPKSLNPLKIESAYYRAVQTILNSDGASIYHVLRLYYGRTHFDALFQASDMRIMLAQLLILQFEGKLELR